MTGGLRFASTPGYSLATLRVATSGSGANTKYLTSAVLLQTLSLQSQSHKAKVQGSRADVPGPGAEPQSPGTKPWRPEIQFHSPGGQLLSPDTQSLGLSSLTVPAQMPLGFSELKPSSKDIDASSNLHYYRSVSFRPSPTGMAPRHSLPF